MPFWPVAEREARAAARAPRTYGWRAAVTAAGIALIPVSLWVSRSAPSPGRAAFIAVAVMAFIYALFGGVLRTADAIAEEKRENTLGLLFLTDLKVGDVLIGKLLASTATLFFGLLAMLPLLSIPVLIGGVTSRDLILVSLCLVNSLFFSISIGFLVSTFFRQGWVTISVALAAMLGIIFFIPIIANLFPPFLEPCFLVLSPGTMLGAIITNQSNVSFFQCLAVTHLIAWLNIRLTAHFLPKFWQERPRSRSAESRFQKFSSLRFGDAKTRKRFRTRLLNRNPLFWLSGREQVSSFGLMVFMIFLCGLSLLAQWQQILYALIALHGTLLVRMASAASHSLAEDRKSGALELLLATSLSVREVLKGRWMALGRQFFGPILITIMWHLFTILWMDVMSPYPTLWKTLFVALFAFACAWVATGWFGMWMGLRARHPVAAIWGTLATVVLAPLVALGGIFSVLAAFQIIPEYGFPGEHEFEVSGCAIWIGYMIALIFWTSIRVKRAFREAATDRFSDTQPIDWRPVGRLTWKIAATAALVIAAVWGARAFINFRGERALEKILTAHRGFNLTLVPAPYIPENQNLAQWDYLRPLNNVPAFTIRYPLRPNQKMPIEQFVQFPRHPIGYGLTKWGHGEHYSFTHGPSGYWETNYDNELIRLHAATRERPFLRFNVRLPSATDPYQWTPEILYGSILNLPRLLAVRAEKRLELGEHPVDDILLALRFANCMTNEPGTLAVHREAISNVIQPIYDGIHEGRWDDTDLQQIQNAFAQLNPAAHFEIWRYHVAREVANVAAAPPPPTPWGANQLVIGNMPYDLGMAKQRPRLPGKIKSMQARLIEAGLGPTNSLVQTFQTWPRSDSNYGENLEPYLIDIQSVSLARSIGDLAQTQTAIDQVVVACAIERFRLVESKLPSSLGELTPKYLKKVPNDFMTGRPLKYKLNPDGYVLYSVGSNLADDGGVPDTTKTIQGRTQLVPRDWVWIYKK